MYNSGNFFVGKIKIYLQRDYLFEMAKNLSKKPSKDIDLGQSPQILSINKILK